MLERILKYSALISIYLLVLEYQYLQGYYNKFGIDILIYIDYTEILLKSLPLFSYSFPLLLIIFFIVIIDRDFHNTSQTKWDYFVKNVPKIILISLALLLMVVIGEELTEYLSHTKFKWHVYFSTATDFLLFVSFLAIILRQEKVKIHLYIIYFIIAIFFIYEAGWFGVRKYFTVISNNQNIQVSFTKNGKTYKSDSTYLFVGETKGYLFMLDRKKHNTLIFKRDSVDSLYIFQ